MDIIMGPQEYEDTLGKIFEDSKKIGDGEKVRNSFPEAGKILKEFDELDQGKNEIERDEIGY